MMQKKKKKNTDVEVIRRRFGGIMENIQREETRRINSPKYNK